ncbi:unnamed protein product [Zymoseptoria tritici ST99CH_1A5]|uniref:Mob1/phocein n=4 Tax=Zymoseptoria tritici TaxID=1047171 RepID=A0A1X7RHY0_ZYMT9|nr:unnamed protein product [Zymoseptoria tritici ST99CH_3D7]SMR43181.1 unnamed protein product [Zymoseptoria tritici ST99CH_1E4]SMR45343.1 unnamed protein product [Zymoseptoria tritici ST99CH_3D1]SMY20502.1 unnamed protein product [Zymoseptoria tritici ST99CH_1A5]
MSSWMNNLRNFGRQGNSGGRPNAPPSRGNTGSPSAYSSSSTEQPSNPLPSYTPPNMAANEQAHQSNASTANNGTKSVPYFFREKHAGFIVKGNFMTLAAKPQLVEEGEWLAHQVVEQVRQLSGQLKVVQVEDKASGRSLCNELVCPSMYAGNVNYSWIDTNRNPINLPAPTYIKHIQTWVNGKIQDESIFPTSNLQPGHQFPSAEQTAADPSHYLGKASGFPPRFEVEIKNMYKQMFRCYAHLYWAHWNVFWDTNGHRELNTCFMHFVNVGLIFGLLTARDIEPMGDLIDIWIQNGTLSVAKEAGTPAAAGSTPTPASAPVGGATPATASTPTSNAGNPPGSSGGRSA